MAHTHTHTQYLLTHIGTGEFFTNSEIIKLAAKDLCIPEFKLIDGLCEDVLFLICGFNSGNINIKLYVLNVNFLLQQIDAKIMVSLTHVLTEHV